MSKLVSTTEGIGILEFGADETTVALLDLQPPNLGDALRTGLSVTAISAAEVRDRRPATAVRLLATVPRPGKIWAVGFAYADHRNEVGYAADTKDPVIFLKAPSSVIGTDSHIRLPEAAPSAVDYEGELAVVIGQRCSNVSEREAYSVVAGFTICNDVSARDVQKGRISGRAADVSAAKSFDTFTPMGPCLVTIDEFDDPDDLRLQTWVDGQLRQDARTSSLIHPVAGLISYLSRQTTLEPGDVILTGTPSGVGHKQGRYLRPGSEIHIEVDGIGTLRNTCS